MYHQHKKNINLFNFVSFLFLLFNQWILQNHYFLFRVQKAAPLKVVLWFQGQAAIPMKWANRAQGIISTRYFIFKIIQSFLLTCPYFKIAAITLDGILMYSTFALKLYIHQENKIKYLIARSIKQLNFTTSPFNAYVICFIFPVHKKTGFILEFQIIKQYNINHRKTAFSGNNMN